VDADVFGHNVKLERGTGMFVDCKEAYAPSGNEVVMRKGHKLWAKRKEDGSYETVVQGDTAMKRLWSLSKWAHEEAITKQNPGAEAELYSKTLNTNRHDPKLI
jgi:hypothetical protein